MKFIKHKFPTWENISFFIMCSLVLSSLVVGTLHAIINRDVQVTTLPVQQAFVQIAALALMAGMSIAKGIKQNKQAREIEKMNIRPEYRISRGTLANIALAKQASQEGLTPATYNKNLNQLNLGFSSALQNNILYGRGNTNVNTAVRAYNEGVDNLNAADEQARVRGRQELMEANSQLAREEQNQFNWQAEGYQEKAQRAAQLRSAGDENIYSAAGTALSAVASGDVKLGGFGGKLKATGPGALKPTTSMSMSKVAIGEGLASDYNKIIKDSLSSRGVVSGGQNFWKTAGTLR